MGLHLIHHIKGLHLVHPTLFFHLVTYLIETIQTWVQNVQSKCQHKKFSYLDGAGKQPNTHQRMYPQILMSKEGEDLKKKKGKIKHKGLRKKRTCKKSCARSASFNISSS
jgi:hypothetical protein